MTKQEFEMEFVNKIKEYLLIEIFGLVATVIAVIGVVLNNRRIRACFILWLFSNGLSLAIHLNAGIYSLALRDLVFVALAIEGWFLWKGSKFK